MLRKVLRGLLVLLVFVMLVWLSDRVTLQGERTIFTVKCDQGTWQGSHCAGKLASGERYAFRASARRHEVIYWIRASDTPSGKYTDCTVIDRDNWSCNVRADKQPTIAYEMVNGRPTRGSQGLTLPFHDVAKWKWWLMNFGIELFSDANE